MAQQKLKSTEQEAVIASGVSVISGTAGKGKTSVALELGGSPDQIFYCNFDTKPLAPSIQRQLGVYASYMGLLLSAGDNEVAIVDKFLSDIEEVKVGQYKTIILDGYERLYGFLQPYIVRNANTIRTMWPGGGKWQVQAKLGYRKTFEPGMLAWLLEKFEHVIIITHSGKTYVNDVALDGDVPLISHSLLLTANVVFWLVEDDTGYPRALVRKNKATTTYSKEKGWMNVPTFPDVLSFQAIGGYKTPYTSLATVIEHYEANPFGNKPVPESFEQMTDVDLAIIRNTLTPEDKRRIAIKQLLVAKTASDNFGTIQEIYNNGTPQPLKIKIAAAKLGLEIELDEIAKVVTILEGVAQAEAAYRESALTEKVAVTDDLGDSE